MRPPRPASGSASGKRAPAFAQRLIAWQRVHGRHDLPWQGTRDAYCIWLSEIMLQQTQVATVLPYYARFTASFPDVAALARAPLSRVLELWSGLGYYRRAHHLHAAARAVVDRHGGKFPTTASELETLPGVGRSTAAAIAAFASGERAAILDGNVKRVLARHRGIDGWPGNAAVAAKLWSVAEGLLPPPETALQPAAGPAAANAQSRSAPSAMAVYTQALMDLGATVCTRARPRCDACPVASDCIARREGRTGDLPSPRPRYRRPERAIRVLILERDGRILLERRPPLGIWAGLWSFPEMPVDADPAAEIGSRCRAVAVIQALAPIRHSFTHFTLTLHPLHVAVAGSPSATAEPGVEWFTREAAIAAAVPAPIRKLLLRLQPSFGQVPS
jgi:A/G-specific adenine glycosylase